jgi:acyl carrier protein
MPEREILNLKIIEILAEIALVPESFAFNPSVKLKEDLELDSLGLISLIMELNNFYGIEIKSEEIIPENFETIGNLAEFIERKLIV